VEKIKLAEAMYDGIPILIQSPLLFAYFWILIRPGKTFIRLAGILSFHLPLYAGMTYAIDQKAWGFVNEVGIQAEDEQRYRAEKYA
jgi:hypothetical protein